MNTDERVWWECHELGRTPSHPGHIRKEPNTPIEEAQVSGHFKSHLQ